MARAAIVIDVREGDGYRGWPEKGPFDAIVVTAATERIPEPLLNQLAPGGRMAVVVGEEFSPQQLVLVTKSIEGRITTRNVLAMQFVPLTGDH